MTKTQTIRAETALPASQQEVLNLHDALKQFNFALFGHGTPCDDPQSFFNNGVYASSYDDLTSIAIPLDGSNIASVDDWPHKKYSSLPNVVLLGVPNPDPEQGVAFSQLLTHIYDEDETGHNVLSPRYVLGFYAPDTKELVINPDFDLTNESHTVELRRIGSTIVRQPTLDFAHPKSTDYSDGTSTKTLMPTAPTEMPDIW